MTYKSFDDSTDIGLVIMLMTYQTTTCAAVDSIKHESCAGGNDGLMTD